MIIFWAKFQKIEGFWVASLAYSEPVENVYGRLIKIGVDQ